MYNRLILIGRLGKDAEAKGAEKNVVSINVATVNYYKKKTGEAVNEVEWTNCLAFGKLGELILSQAKKGDLVVVEGKKKTNSYEHEGQTRINVYLMVDHFQRLSWQQQEKPVETTATKDPTPEEEPSEMEMAANTKRVLTPVNGLSTSD